MRRCMFTHAGMTLIEVVIALMVIMLLQPLVLTTLSIASRTDYHWTSRQNQLGMLQLRRKIALGIKMSLTTSALSLTFNDQKLRFVCEDGMLLQQPGSMPYLIGLSSCSWIKRNHLIFLSFTEGEETHELIVGLWT